MLTEPREHRVYKSRLYALMNTEARSAVKRVSTEHFGRCELCTQIVPDEHRHLLDLSKRKLVCACRACSTLFADGSIGGRNYQLIPDDVTELQQFTLSEVFWSDLAVPVDLAFFFTDTAGSRAVVLYPGPMGAAESQLAPSAWMNLMQANPVLLDLRPDVQALLVNRTRGMREQWIVPIDTCYSLVGLIRLNWRGLGGGEEVWVALHEFFAALRARALPPRILERSSSHEADSQ